MRIVRTHESETALMEIIVAIEDTFLLAQILREVAFDDLPTMIETSTLKYGCYAKGYQVAVSAIINRVISNYAVVS